LILEKLPPAKGVRRIVDIGADSGAGGLIVQHSLRWAIIEGKRLQPGSHMISYPDIAVVEGQHELLATRQSDLPALGCSLRYLELDADVFREKLETPVYRDVERIAAVGALITKRGGLRNHRGKDH
jgi:hypothetical protein